ncbi:MAG: DUF1987 domain-containing protein [Bacteroidales bacterium]|nr:DUF1987 domain-containing protein [Bacteroidales bacterium]
MNNINIQATVNTPVIEFENSGKLLISGRSLPENVSKFYLPLINWAKALNSERVIADIRLEYTNSSSTKKLLEILKSIDRNNSVREFIVNWYYEIDDEDSFENGKILAELLKKADFKFYKSNTAA